jgi:hypothetical protein
LSGGIVDVYKRLFQLRLRAGARLNRRMTRIFINWHLIACWLKKHTANDRPMGSFTTRIVISL